MWKEDRDGYLLQVMTEAQVENNMIEPSLLPKNQNKYDKYDDTSDSEDLLELLRRWNESYQRSPISRESEDSAQSPQTVNDTVKKTEYMEC